MSKAIQFIKYMPKADFDGVVPSDPIQLAGAIETRYAEQGPKIVRDLLAKNTTQDRVDYRGIYFDTKLKFIAIVKLPDSGASESNYKDYSTIFTSAPAQSVTTKEGVEVYSKEEIDALFKTKLAELSTSTPAEHQPSPGAGLKVETYNKSEIDALFLTKLAVKADTSNVYTKEEIEAKLRGIQGTSLGGDLSSYLTATQAEDMLASFKAEVDETIKLMSLAVGKNNSNSAIEAAKKITAVKAKIDEMSSKLKSDDIQGAKVIYNELKAIPDFDISLAEKVISGGNKNLIDSIANVLKESVADSILSTVTDKPLVEVDMSDVFNESGEELHKDPNAAGKLSDFSIGLIVRKVEQLAKKPRTYGKIAPEELTQLANEIIAEVKETKLYSDDTKAKVKRLEDAIAIVCALTPDEVTVKNGTPRTLFKEEVFESKILIQGKKYAGKNILVKQKDNASKITFKKNNTDLNVEELLQYEDTAIIDLNDMVFEKTDALKIVIKKDANTEFLNGVETQMTKKFPQIHNKLLVGATENLIIFSGQEVVEGPVKYWGYTYTWEPLFTLDDIATISDDDGNISMYMFKGTDTFGYTDSKGMLHLYNKTDQVFYPIYKVDTSTGSNGKLDAKTGKSTFIYNLDTGKYEEAPGEYEVNNYIFSYGTLIFYNNYRILTTKLRGITTTRLPSSLTAVKFANYELSKVLVIYKTKSYIVNIENLEINELEQEISQLYRQGNQLLINMPEGKLSLVDMYDFNKAIGKFTYMIAKQQSVQFIGKDYSINTTLQFNLFSYKENNTLKVWIYWMNNFYYVEIPNMHSSYDLLYEANVYGTTIQLAAYVNNGSGSYHKATIVLNLKTGKYINLDNITTSIALFSQIVDRNLPFIAYYDIANKLKIANIDTGQVTYTSPETFTNVSIFKPTYNYNTVEAEENNWAVLKANTVSSGNRYILGFNFKTGKLYEGFNDSSYVSFSWAILRNYFFRYNTSNNTCEHVFKVENDQIQLVGGDGSVNTIKAPAVVLTIDDEDWVGSSVDYKLVKLLDRTQVKDSFQEVWQDYQHGYGRKAYLVQKRYSSSQWYVKTSPLYYDGNTVSSNVPYDTDYADTQFDGNLLLFGKSDYTQTKLILNGKRVASYTDSFKLANTVAYNKNYVAALDTSSSAVVKLFDRETGNELARFEAANLPSNFYKGFNFTSRMAQCLSPRLVENDKYIAFVINTCLIICKKDTYEYVGLMLPSNECQSIVFIDPTTIYVANATYNTSLQNARTITINERNIKQSSGHTGSDLFGNVPNSYTEKNLAWSITQIYSYSADVIMTSCTRATRNTWNNLRLHNTYKNKVSQVFSSVVYIMHNYNYLFVFEGTSMLQVTKLTVLNFELEVLNSAEFTCNSSNMQKLNYSVNEGNASLEFIIYAYGSSNNSLPYNMAFCLYFNPVTNTLKQVNASYSNNNISIVLHKTCIAASLSSTTDFSTLTNSIDPETGRNYVLSNNTLVKPRIADFILGENIVFNMAVSGIHWRVTKPGTYIGLAQEFTNPRAQAMPNNSVTTNGKFYSKTTHGEEIKNFTGNIFKIGDKLIKQENTNIIVYNSENEPTIKEFDWSGDFVWYGIYANEKYIIMRLAKDNSATKYFIIDEAGDIDKEKTIPAVLDVSYTTDITTFETKEGKYLLDRKTMEVTRPKSVKAQLPTNYNVSRFAKNSAGVEVTIDGILIRE